MSVEASWYEHYRDEMDAAWLYRRLASSERNPKHRDIFARLANVEDAHVERWRQLFAARGATVPEHRPSFRSHALAWLGSVFGSSLILPLIVAEETREVGAYLRMAERSPRKTEHEAAIAIASESAVHAQELSEAFGRTGEPWHNRAGGGYLRSVVYGFNDGLTANFGLVAGVIGADVAPHIVVITGIAGALADALSMGSSGYLAAKSEAEMIARQVSMEREEIRLMPDLEEDELALIYEAKGLTPDNARETARTLMRDPERALDTQVQEELGIQKAAVTPLADGMVTGTATALGALIPLLPFFALPEGPAIWASLTVSMLAHFGVGAARSFFTGRGIWTSGRDMFLVGFGVAAVGYVIGDLLVK